jgi:TonB family protein
MTTVTVTTPQSPRALILSVLLHVGFVLLLVLVGWLARQRVQPPVQIFELVAGAGDDYMAKEAPTTVAPPPTVKLPPLPDPVVVTPPAPKITPAPEPPPPKQETPPPPPKKEPAPKKELTPPPPKEKTPPPPKIEKAPERLTLDDFRQKHGAPKTPTPKAPPPVTPKKIDVGRVAAATENQVKAGAGGTAMTSAEEDQWKRYTALLVQRIRASMQRAGIIDLRTAGVQFRVSANGEISGATITRSSGSAEFDNGILEALRGLGRVPPPPSGRNELISTTIQLTEGA